MSFEPLPDFSDDTFEHELASTFLNLFRTKSRPLTRCGHYHKSPGAFLASKLASLNERFIVAVHRNSHAPDQASGFTLLASRSLVLQGERRCEIRLVAALLFHAYDSKGADGQWLTAELSETTIVLFDPILGITACETTALVVAFVTSLR